MRPSRWSGGFHLGLNVTELRPGYQVGDATDAPDIAGLTRPSFRVAPYLSLTIAQDVFERIRGYRSTE